METSTEPKIIPFSYRFLTIDYLLRWFALGIYNYLIPYEQTTLTHKLIFVGVQVLLAIFTFFVVLLHEYDYYKFENDIHTEEGLGEKIGNMFANIAVERHYYIHQTFLSVLLRAFFVLTVAYMMLVVFNQDRNMLDAKNVYGMVFAGCGALFAYSAFVLYTSSFCVDYHFAKKPKQVKVVKPSAAKVVIETPILHHETTENTIRTETPKRQKPSKPVEQAASTATQTSDLPHEVDDNDIELINMEGRVHNYSSRVQEYALESVIFSGLSVSGFVIAASSGKINFQLLQTFGLSISSLVKDIITMSFGGFDKYEIFKMTPEDLSFLMMFLCLHGAMSFLLVIVNRIKFNDLIEQVDNAIRKARNYNTKEEEIFLVQLQHESGSLQGEQAEIISNRLAELSEKIAVQIAKAHTYTHEVEAILAYITFFRKIGVLLFVATILVGLVLFDPAIAIFFASMGVLIYVYRQYDDWHREKRLAKWATS